MNVTVRTITPAYIKDPIVLLIYCICEDLAIILQSRLGDFYIASFLHWWSLFNLEGALH